MDHLPFNENSNACWYKSSARQNGRREASVFTRFPQILIQEDDLATLGGSLSGLYSKYRSTAALFVAKINMASQANKRRSKQKYFERKGILLRSRYVDSLQDVIEIFCYRSTRPYMI